MISSERPSSERGYSVLYAVDRTAGRREQQVLRHHGDHSFGPDILSDTDEEDGVRGSTMLTRPPALGSCGRKARALPWTRWGRRPPTPFSKVPRLTPT